MTIGPDSSVWCNAVLRADLNSIVIGRCSNIQDNCVVHCSKENGVVIGDCVSIGHGAILHGCRIGNNCIVGMGSIILDGARIGNNCIVGAGSIVTKNKVFPDKSLILGSPASVKRKLTEEEVEEIIKNAEDYVSLKKQKK